MAVRRVARFVDDLDGSAAAETVWFGLDGVSYEVDLSAANAAALRRLFDPYVTAGRSLARVEAGAARRVRQALARASHSTAAATRPALTTAGRDVPQEPPPRIQPATSPPPTNARMEPARVRFSDQHTPTAH